MSEAIYMKESEAKNMKEIVIRESRPEGIDDSRLKRAIEQSIENRKTALKKVLLLPPDITRAHSGAGKITAMYYKILKNTCKVEIMPAVGSHFPMTAEERTSFFGSEIPQECYVDHHWRTDVVKIGEVPGKFVESISDGLMDSTIDVEVNRRLVDKSYDLILSIGQVVPHEVVGMANYSKNIFVGCGGSKMISQTHMLGAFYGLERIMGRDHSPVRKVFDYAEERFTKEIPLVYVLTVTTQNEGKTSINGLFIGRNRKLFEEAVALSQEKNLNYVEKPLKKVIVYLEEEEFRSTWVGNKSIYRTRMAIADGGELLVLAPGIKHCGEDPENDRLIKKYGYVGRERVLQLFRENRDLQENQSVAAHLIHGSSDGRFSITYAVQHMTREEIEGINFHYMPLKEAYKKYDPQKLKEGFNMLPDGEEVYFISNPALGLWMDRSRI